jgi:hypothetical protein
METNTVLAIVIPVSGLLVASIVAVINFWNHRLATEKLKLELFEKRFAVYRAAQTLLSRVLQDGEVKKLKYIFEYRRDTQVAYFLFDQEIVKYLDSLDRKALDLWAKGQAYNSMNVCEQRTELVSEAHDICMQLVEELPELKKAFEPYMRFKAWS